MLPFTAWLMMINLLTSLFDLADRQMIVHCSAGNALAEVGNYRSSRIVPLLLASVTAMIAAVATPHLACDWEAGRRGRVSAQMNLLLKVLAAALTAGAVLVLAAAPLLFQIAFRGKYAGGLAVMPWTLIYCIWFGLTIVAQKYLWCAERAGLVGLALLLGLAVNVGLNLLLLPRLGLLGAVLATAAANFVALMVVVAISRRLGFRVDLGTWVALLLPAGRLPGTLDRRAGAGGRRPRRGRSPTGSCRATRSGCWPPASSSTWRSSRRCCRGGAARGRKADMTRPRVIHLASLGRAAPPGRPLGRPLVAQRRDHAHPPRRADRPLDGAFRPRARFRALVVEHEGQWLAALPLLGRRIARILPAGATVGNPWSTCADLLWDTARTADAEIGDVLAEAMARLPWQLLWLDGAALDAPQWRAMQFALDRAGTTAVCRRRWLTGRLPIDQHWPACQERWSSRHRRNLARGLERLAAAGDATFEVADHLGAAGSRAPLREAFAVEDAGWKGAAGTSVLHTPGMFDFFLRQARQLAHWGQLALAVLRCDGRPVAFSYGLAAKGVFHSWKVGYDARYADCSPGQLLRYHLIEWLHADGRYEALDFCGPLNEAQARWRPDTYTVGRLIVAPRRWLRRWALRAYACCRPAHARVAPP